VSIRASVDEVVAALEAAGVRVATRAGDITPPVVYVQIGTVGETGMPLAGGLVAGLYLYVIPIRGVDNVAADADLLDTVMGAVGPIGVTETTATRTTVTVTGDLWPCYRVDLTAMSTATAGARNAH
jgi:hypothetical protein